MKTIVLANPPDKQSLSDKYEKYFVRSGSRWPHYRVKFKKWLPAYLPFPFFLAYSASLLRKSGFDVYVIDGVALDISYDEFLERIKTIGPEVLFYEFTPYTFDEDIRLARDIKKSISSCIISGGPYATACAFDIMKNNPEVDFLIKGEYELALKELIEYLGGRSSYLPNGIVFRDNGNLVYKGDYLLPDTLDYLPPPAREIFPSNDKPDLSVYWDGFCQNFPALQVQSSRGCFYRCYFCLWSQTIYGQGNFRRFSPRRVCEELEDAVSKYGPKELYFDDDDFLADKKHAAAICKEIMKSRMKLPWSCMGNLNNIDTELLDLMAESGCIGIKTGIESGSREILEKIGKPVDIEKIKVVLKAASKKAIKIHGTFCIGLKDETASDIDKTFSLIKKLPLSSLQISIAYPFPGTEFFDWYKKKQASPEPESKLRGDPLTEPAGKFYLKAQHENLRKVRKNIFLYWLLSRFVSPVWIYGNIKILVRTLKGLGPVLFIRNFVSVLIDTRENS